MNKRNLKNSELDSIGKKLIEQGSLPVAAIDKIVSNEDLFTRINARIMANGLEPQAEAFTPSPLSAFLRRNQIAFGGLAVVVMTVLIAYSVLQPDKVHIDRAHNNATTAVSVPVIEPEVARPESLPPQVVGRNPSPGRAQDREVRYEKAVVVSPARDRRRTQPEMSDDAEGEFYAVSNGGDPADTSDGGRVIRVDLNRASLFALGVNVPLENDNETVKADLLIGRDGVTRAVRVIK